jgi:hypothetical protein
MAERIYITPQGLELLDEKDLEIARLRAENERLTAIIKAIEERRLILQSDGRWMGSNGTLTDFAKRNR